MNKKTQTQQIRKRVDKRVESLNKDIAKLVRYAENYIKKLDPAIELNFEDVEVTEFRCEQCGSINIQDVSYNSEDGFEDVGFECEEGHFTFVRKE